MFFENDRTFCGNAECKHSECYRNQANIVGNPRFISLSMFEGTKECKKSKVELILAEVRKAVASAREESYRLEYKTFDDCLDRNLREIERKYTEEGK